MGKDTWDDFSADGEEGIDRDFENEDEKRYDQQKHRQWTNGPNGNGGEKPFEWGEPDPLLEILEREPYPVLALPDGIREAVEEATGFLQCPPEMAASSALSVLSLAGQGIANVARSETLISPTSLYFFAAIESGERKSQADKLFTKPVERYQQEMQEQAAVEIKNYLSAKASWDARRLGIMRALSAKARKNEDTANIDKRLRDLEALEPVKPRILQLLHENITAEGLAWSLHTGWPTAAVISPEAGVVLGGHAMRAEAISQISPSSTSCGMAPASRSPGGLRAAVIFCATTRGSHLASRRNQKRSGRSSTRREGWPAAPAFSRGRC